MRGNAMFNPLIDIDPAQPEVCCGTCTHWVYSAEVNGPACPKQAAPLPLDLKTRVCRQWQREAIEWEAVALWKHLRGEA
jgi:hypothetical protein